MRVITEVIARRGSGARLERGGGGRRVCKCGYVAAAPPGQSAHITMVGFYGSKYRPGDLHELGLLLSMLD